MSLTTLDELREPLRDPAVPVAARATDLRKTYGKGDTAVDALGA